MSRLLSRIKRLERDDGSCAFCGWPDNTVQLHIVEELVTTHEQVRAAVEQTRPPWLVPCEACGRTPNVAEVVELETVTSEGDTVGIVYVGGIPQRK